MCNGVSIIYTTEQMMHKLSSLSLLEIPCEKNPMKRFDWFAFILFFLIVFGLHQLFFLFFFTLLILLLLLFFSVYFVSLYCILIYVHENRCICVWCGVAIRIIKQRSNSNNVWKLAKEMSNAMHKHKTRMRKWWGALTDEVMCIFLLMNKSVRTEWNITTKEREEQQQQKRKKTHNRIYWWKIHKPNRHSICLQ